MNQIVDIFDKVKSSKNTMKPKLTLKIQNNTDIEPKTEWISNNDY